jgi:voltage-gated potassium channel
MTPDLNPSERRRLEVRAGLHILFTAALLLAAYALAPADLTNPTRTGIWFAFAIGAVAVLIAMQVRSIMTASYPVLQAIESLVTAVLVVTILFALLYLDLSHSNPGYFSEPLDHVGALYFSVTVFATVGFGDITAKSDASRIIVTLQMFLDLLFIALVIRLFFHAAGERSRQH